MDNIENQTKTEIQELLTELVVTPVSEAFTSKLTEISETYTLIEKIRGKIDSIDGLITRVKNDVSAKIDDVSVSTGCITKTIKGIGHLEEHVKEMETVLKEGGIEINKIQAIANNLGEVKGQIDTLRNGVSDTKGTINTIKEQIGSFSNQLNEMKSILEEEKVEISKIQENANVLGQVKNQLDLMRNNNKYIHFFMVCIFLLNVGIMIWLLFR